ncbi:MAG: VOC family protein [Burkholderiaceae bacterium]
MAKLIHTMIRVLDAEKSMQFYDLAFGMKVSHKLDYPDFALIYLRGTETDAEIELTVNKDRTEPYTHGDGYGHYAFAVDDLEGSFAHMTANGIEPTPIKEFKDGETLLARFFFVTDPDGYKIEVLERHGHYQ